jgi:hypothetical protein
MKPPNKLYEFHVENLRAIDLAIDQVARSLRRAVSREDEKTTLSFTRLHALLLGAWAECRLRKLIYEPNGFDKQERALVHSKDTQLKRWRAAVEAAFRKHYDVPSAPLSDSTLCHSAYARYITIVDMLDNDLRPIIELRNKLAHGQWAYPLNSDGDDVAQEQMDTLRRENLLSLQFKKALISYLSGAIHDLVVSCPTFERDFDEHYRSIVNARRNLKTRDYESWAKQMREKYQRGKVKRARAYRRSP